MAEPFGTHPQWIIPHTETRSVGIPIAIGTGLIAAGAVSGIGVLMPEFAFDPQPVIAELSRRKILIHETIGQTSTTD